MNTEWIKKNWLTVAIIGLVIAIVIYYSRKEDGKIVVTLPAPKIPGTAARGSAPAGETAAQAKSKLDECLKSSANIRMATTGVHPCATLQDAYDKISKGSKESSYGVFTPTQGLNTIDYGIGLQGTALLKDKQLTESSYGCRGNESGYGCGGM